MPWVALPDLDDGDTVYGANMDDVRGNLEFLGAMKWGLTTLSALSAGYTLGGGGWLAKKTATQAISASTTTTITWDSEDFDTLSAFASNAFTVPTGLGGIYLIAWRLSITAGPTGNYGTLRKNSSLLLTNLGSPAFGVIPLSLAAGDVIDMQYYGGTGSTIEYANYASFFGGLKVG